MRHCRFCEGSLGSSPVLLILLVTWFRVVNAISIGQTIQDAGTAQELLQAASSLWLPTDDNVAPHLRTQKVHHDKRQRWSAQLLEKLGTMKDVNVALQVKDDRITRAILGAAIPFETAQGRVDKEGIHVPQALLGLHTIFGNVAVIHLSTDAVNGIFQLIQRAILMAPFLTLSKVVETRWAIRGIVARLPIDKHISASIDISILDDLVSSLPFDILPLGIQWDQIVPPPQNVVAMLRQEIPFHVDTIVTRTGAIVTERRATTWVAAPNIGALAYSGKLMTPNPIPPVVHATMRAVERTLGQASGHGHSLESSPHSDNDYDQFFDCALCNHYPDADTACKFHTDPEHGTLWERLTCVVAAGEARRFAFRPIPGKTTWDQWTTPITQRHANCGEDTYDNDHANEPAVIHLFSGDIVNMWGACNDDFYHAVYTADGEVRGGGRVSLVLKRAMDRGGGKRGHGLAGEGRRSRRKSFGEGGMQLGLPLRSRQSNLKSKQ